MSYLQRRIALLVNELEQGKLKLSEDILGSEVGVQLRNDLLSIQKLPNGEIDLSSCSSLVKSTAKTLYLVKRSTELEDQKEQNSTIVSPDTISIVMKEYFQMLEDFFIDATGIKPDKFAIHSSFSEQIRKNAEMINRKAPKTLEKYVPAILNFHGKNTNLLLNAGKAIGGLKNVMGGNSRFSKSAFDGLRKFALYTDTIFIPDPILPWVEIERKEERFIYARLLEACHDLLRLKPLVDANLPYPAVVVFPSWEKSLENSDNQTQDGISELILSFFSYYLNATFEDESEIVNYVTNSGKERFFETVERHQLFFAPNATSILPINEAIKQYKNEISTWRSKEWMDAIEKESSEFLVLNGIMERILPQFHVRDNAFTLDAQPLFWLDPHFHYFKLCSEAGNNSLKDEGLLNPKTLATLQSLLHPNLAWLGNVPIQDLARMREENQNEAFRRKLSSYIGELSESKLGNIDQVAAEVTRAIASLLAEHDKEAKQMNEEYDKKHMTTIPLSLLTAGVSFYPWLTPFIGASAMLAPVGKAAFDFYNKSRDKRTLTRTLTGVLSVAHSNRNNI